MKARLIPGETVTLFQPLDTEARQWIASTAPSDAQFLGESMAVAPRYVDGVVAAFEAEGGELVA